MVTEASLERLVAIARRGGDAIMRHYGTDAGVRLKDDHSPLTAADRDAHDVIVAELAAWTTDLPVVSEEGTLPAAAERQAWTRFWLVDPLDGTKEFLNRNGEFTVNIALIDGGEPVLGVVHAPAIATTYWAGLGLGSWKRDGQGALVRLRGPSLPGPEGLIVVESRSHPSAALEAWLASRRVARRMQIGSSLKFGVLAEGRAHAYPRLGRTMEWDVAAGDCVWRNASLNGARPSPLKYNTPGLDSAGFVIGVGI